MTTGLEYESDMKRYYIFLLPPALCFISAAGAADLPDPTRPADYSVNIETPVEQDKKAVDFNLTAIRIDPDDRSAIINGHLVREGDEVGSARLVEIHPADVVLDYDRRHLVVRLYHQLSKTLVQGASDKTETTN